MTRPQIIRADTHDLQQKSSPTAQDHSLQPEHPAPLGIGPAAPHQEAALRQVDQERSSEESNLHNAWNKAGTDLRPDPGSDDEGTTVTIGIERHNGRPSSGDDDDADMQDADLDDDDDMDDDMRDQISSSPSIDDGRSSLPFCISPWSTRRDSLTPQSSPLQSRVNSSSPFTTTPIHFPISAASQSPTQFSTFPISFPLSAQNQSLDHHRGKYAWTTPAHTPVEPDQIATTAPLPKELSPRTKHLKLVERRLQLLRDDSQASLMSDYDEEQVKSMLQPMPKPPTGSIDKTLPDATVPLLRTTSGTPPPQAKYPQDEQDSWTTDSDADSWDQDLDQANSDASNDVSFSYDIRFVDSGWGGECLREIEDIDFESVYALHTFVATVEGQANATKGDTMVLLDDSNSYWWLVRVVKDSSIGYLPAEHIETPTERLARLNKHRNIDLSATMLGDTAVPPKNPLKKAMRRRNAKTVQFAPPTYVEASDYDDYSSEEGDDELFGGPEPKQEQQQQAARDVDSDDDDGLKVQPLKLGAGNKEARSDDDSRSTDPTTKDRVSDEGPDSPLDPKVTRNGTVRNTDSFFRDDNTETRKITLTPNLLRDDSSTSTTGSRERGASLESLEKTGFADKGKDDKKKKEKKSGMLSGLFKRKDKKSKSDSIDSDSEKLSDETERSSSQPKPSEESTDRSSAEQTSPGPQRQSSKSKLQKTPRHREGSPPKTKGILKTDSPMEAAEPDIALDPPASKSATQQTTTMRLVSPDHEPSIEPSVEEPDHSSPQGKAGVKSPSPIKKPQQGRKVGPEQVHEAKQREQLDDFDSDSDESNDPFADPDAQNHNLARTETAESVGRLSESPVHVSYPDSQKKAHTQSREQDDDSQQQPPGLSIDTSSQETSSPVSTPTPDDSPTKSHSEKLSISTSITRGSSPHLAPIDENSISMGHSPPVSSESTMLPPWSDACLRSYLDDGSEIRDMLTVIHDTTGVEPVGKEHPLMKGFLVEEEKSLGALSGQLDALLKGLMGRGRKIGSVEREGSGASVRSKRSAR